MTTQERIQTEMAEAMRGRDSARLSVLRMMKSAIKMKEVETMKDRGKVMKVVMVLLAGKTAEGARVSRVAKERLS